MSAFHSLCFSPSSFSTTNLATKPPFLKPSKSFPHSDLTLPLPLPLHLPDLPTHVKEKILSLEIMGIDSGRALSLNPDLRDASLDSIHSLISFLQSKGIHPRDFPRIFAISPRILTSSIHYTLAPVFAYLSKDLKVPNKSFRRVINKCPKMLVSSVKDQLKPALIYLQGLGITDTDALAYQYPVLLVSRVEKTLIPKLEFLKGLGLSREEAAGMVVRCPGLFTFSVENNFKPKYEYFEKEMDGCLEELKEFPQYFAFSLAKRIKPRHQEMVEAQNPKTLLLPISQPKISSFNQSMATLNSFLTNSISLSSSSILHRKFSLTKPIHLPIRAQITSSSISEKTQEKRAVSASVPAETQEIIDEEAKYMVGTYARFPVAVESGKSCKLYDFGGKEYLDMASGIAVNSLGHGNPDLNEVLMQQGNTVWHVSNVYYTQPQVKLAKRLVECTFADRVFFTNSGTEANEAAIKFARKFQRNSLSDGRKPATEFIAFTNSFHGRTMGAVALTSKQAYRLPFEPVMPGVTFVEYGNIEDAKKAIVSGKTAAVFVEPIQGEGGIYSATKEFLQSLRTACNDAGALLIYDEVQCGLGRTGQLWAHETYGVVPDIMTLAKPLAGGLPIGAVLVTEAVASAINHGDHGSTFAGSPLVCKVALKVLDKIQEPAFLASVAKKGLYFKDLLIKKLGGNPHVKEVRGLGLILGIDLDVPASPLVKACLESGLMVLTAGKGNVVRLVPPLIISEEELEYAADVLKSCLPVLDDKQ